MFFERLASSIVLMIITTLCIILGGDILLGTLTIISLIGMMELYRVFNVNKASFGILGYIATILYFVSIRGSYERYSMILFVGFLLGLMVILVVEFPKYKTQDISIAFMGLFYVGVMLSYIYKVRVLEGGKFLVWLIFIGAWGSDTCAYCVGVLFGKRKILPKLSPKKTLEGSIGGIVGAALLGFIFATVLKDKITGINKPQIAFAIIGGSSSLISQLGDFAASAIKRSHDIKDYGKLIPGHGGVLDRFDSIIFTAPIVYILALVL